MFPLFKRMAKKEQDKRRSKVSPRSPATPEYTAPLVLIGLDIGSTTAKIVVRNSENDAVLWQHYRRHDARLAETCLEFLEEVASLVPKKYPCRVFLTGSGGSTLSHLIGGYYVHEVNAVSLAVERLYPDTRSVIELGGQDAKIIIFRNDPVTKAPRKFATMNDKCAGGTGAIIDKIAAKLGISSEQLSQMRYENVRIHPIAGKCGVFAETDINSLQKQGVPAEELVASLFESIVQQNLSVLTRGNTLLPKVLLLGGPNFFLKGLQECWRRRLWQIWEDRDVTLHESFSPEELILVPENAHYFGALGAIIFGQREMLDNPLVGLYAGTNGLRRFIDRNRTKRHLRTESRALIRSEEELAAFKTKYWKAAWTPPVLPKGTTVEAFLGIDAGSTSTKAVLIGRDGQLLAKAYHLSSGNPLEDIRTVLHMLEHRIVDQGTNLRVLGVGTTGYAKDILREAIGADIALVETIAHAKGALHYYPNADVICDVGGQDIKILFLKHGVVKDFRLNTQCSAGNGYYLQATAQSLGVKLSDYADVAFSAETMPLFSHGCAVFLQSDIVDFQRQGWQPNEILAGLAAVLPKNIWLYVCQIPNLVQLGQVFVLQGGTQRNLAAVKAQVDFIWERFKGTGIEPNIIVHEHCGESGALGCAFEVQRMYEEKPFMTSFIGLEAAQKLQYVTSRGEETRCRFCANQCMRTFIDVTLPATQKTQDLIPHEHKPLEHGNVRRIIIANCEKGTVEDVQTMRCVQEKIENIKKATLNLADYAAIKAFQPVKTAPLNKSQNRSSVSRILSIAFKNLRRKRMERRKSIIIGIPRVLNMYGLAPFFMGLFQSLGVPEENIVWSDPTSDGLYREGLTRGSIDPCFPSKLCIAHIHNLLRVKHPEYQLTHIFFPMIESVPSFLVGTQDSFACPTSTATPEAVHAAFIKEGDLFQSRGIVFKKTFLSIAKPGLCARQFAEDWNKEIAVTREEAYDAVLAGLQALQDFQTELRELGKKIINDLAERKKLGIVLLARPYHNDPGINHGIPEAFQKLGYPILTLDSLPIDQETLDSVFAEDIQCGALSHPLSIEDVWKNSFSENSSRKIWAAKFVARHPNLIPLELSNFKCGHDAPISSVVREIIESAGKPFFYFKDIDENKPTGSLKIRIETIFYFLKSMENRMAINAEPVEEAQSPPHEAAAAQKTTFSGEEQLSTPVSV